MGMPCPRCKSKIPSGDGRVRAISSSTILEIEFRCNVCGWVTLDGELDIISTTNTVKSMDAGIA